MWGFVVGLAPIRELACFKWLIVASGVVLTLNSLLGLHGSGGDLSVLSLNYNIPFILAVGMRSLRFSA
jgi:hypothetical protein